MSNAVVLQGGKWRFREKNFPLTPTCGAAVCQVYGAGNVLKGAARCGKDSRFDEKDEHPTEDA
jgi:hypothetical protein